jgi:uncharacterized protein
MSQRPFIIIRFLTVFTLLIAGLHWYVWRRLVADAALPRRGKRFAAAGYAVLIAVFLYGGMGGRFRGVSPLWARWTANLWLGVLGLLVCCLFALDIVRFGLWAGQRLRRSERSPPAPERRQFLSRVLAGSAAAATAALSGAAIYEGIRRVRIKPVEIALDKLAKEHDGYRITQITDVHVGPTLGKDFVEEVAESVLSTKPDLLVITGDLVDGDVDELAPLLEPLRRVQPREGVFFCTGNHEYYSGVQQWLEHLPKMGIRPLQNERVRLSAFELAGVPDWSAKDFRGVLAADVEAVARGRDAQLPLVLLAHQPRHFEDAIDNDIDLHLAGHTHGGQMFPMTIMIHALYPFIAGLYRRGNSQVYVSQGTGYWGPPMRLGTEAEVTQITLRAKA